MTKYLKTKFNYKKNEINYHVFNIYRRSEMKQGDKYFYSYSIKKEGRSKKIIDYCYATSLKDLKRKIKKRNY
jgi:hypothetical protein